MARKFRKADDIQEVETKEETPVVEETKKKKPAKKAKEPVVEEQVETVTEEVVEEVKEEPKEEVKPVSKPKDKFEESKKIDANKSYDDVISILKDSKLNNDQKLDKIYNNTNVTYKALIDAFYEFDNKVYGNQKLRENSQLFNAERNKLWASIKKAVETKDSYVRNAKLAILVLIYNKLKTRTFNHMYLALHGDDFADKEGFQELMFIMVTIGAIATFLANRTYKVRKNINFKHPEFKTGAYFEEFYSSLEMR